MRLRELNKSKQSLAEAGYIGGHNRDDPDYSGIDNVPERIRVRKGSRVMAIPPSALEQFKTDGWTEVDQGVKEDDEYDDESGMAKSGLQTMSRAVSGLMDTIQEGDNLPEWAQQKLSLAEDYLTTVWDYLLSQKEQGTDPKVTEGSQGVDSLVTDTLRIMKGPEISDAELAIKTVLGDRAYNERRSYYSFFINQLVDMYGKPEGSKTVDSLVTNALTVMHGPTRADAIAALKTALGNEEYKSRSTFYKLWINQAVDKYRQQGVTEAKKPSPKLTAVNIKKTAPVSEEINTEAYERLQKVFAFKNYES